MRFAISKLLFFLLTLCTIQYALCLTNQTEYIVDHLWAQVEQRIPVEYALQQTVAETPTHIDIGPDPSGKSQFRTETLTESRIDHLKFRKKFAFGISSSAAQFEGAVKQDGRGPSIWDSYCHLVPAQNKETSCQSIDIGTNFRNLYPLDLARVSAMGVKSYSFSVSWSRVMPLG
jgi:hypothetical protein